MIRLYLASFLQPQNFGPGRVFGIINTNGGKPRNVRIEGLFEYFTPKLELIEQYNKYKIVDAKIAGTNFIDAYKKQLDDFVEELRLSQPRDMTNLTDLLPFQDGDTLASWERAEFTNYRKVLAPYLEKIGFEVILN